MRREAGFDGVFLWDHMQLIADLRLEMFDPWVVAGAITHATNRVQIGALVTPLPAGAPTSSPRRS